MHNTHLIDFPNRKEHKRAIMALLNLSRGEFVGLPDKQLVVTDDQIQALKEAKVTFNYLSRSLRNAENGRQSSSR